VPSEKAVRAAIPSVPVASVFGRTGAVVSQNGDYSFAQISGSVSAAQLPAAAMRTDQGNTVTAGTQDFSGAAHTLPMKSGLTGNLPSLCTTGELYFATDAPPGQNTYGCTATNSWSIQGNLTVKSDDSTVGQRGAINFEAGAGIVTAMTDSGSEINVLLGLDTAVVQTPWGEQTGSALLCASNSGSSSTYLCSLQPTLQVYTIGMTLNWTPDVNGAGGPTSLNVDTLGAVPVKRADGVTDPSPAQIPAGQMQTIWYDGTSFRLAPTTAGGLADSGSNGLLYRSAPGATQPATADLISQPSFCQDTGSVNAYACSLNPPIASYVTGTTYWFRANSTDTGPATINFNSLGAKAIKKYSATGLTGGDITAGQWVMLTYDGVNMQMQSQSANPPENAANKGQVDGYASLDGSGLVPVSQLPNPTRAIGYVFDGGGSTLPAGRTGYYTVPFSCTIRAWNLTVDTGTVTIDAWKAATGAGIPTVSNTITASATPAIASGTALHSTTLTGWTTAVNANDVFGFNVKAVSSATLASLVLECD
jgi:hypothetical protein